MDDIMATVLYLRPSISKWITFVYGLLVSLMAGTLYAYSSYSDHFKSLMDYSQTEANMAIAFGNNGLYISAIFIGRLFDSHGPGATLFVGAICLGVGYTFLGFTLNASFGEGGRGGQNIVLVCLYFLLVGVGSACASVASLATNSYNFPTSQRGRVVGACLGMFGLSGLCISLLFESKFRRKEEDTADFLLTLGITGLLILFGGIIFVRKFTVEEKAKSVVGHSILDDSDDGVASPLILSSKKTKQTRKS